MTPAHSIIPAQQVLTRLSYAELLSLSLKVAGTILTSEAPRRA